MKPIVLEAVSGVSVDYLARTIVGVANVTGKPCAANFNGYVMTARPGATPQVLVSQMRRLTDAKKTL